MRGVSPNCPEPLFYSFSTPPSFLVKRRPVDCSAEFTSSIMCFTIRQFRNCRDMKGERWRTNTSHLILNVTDIYHTYYPFPTIIVILGRELPVVYTSGICFSVLWKRVFFCLFKHFTKSNKNTRVNRILGLLSCIRVYTWLIPMINEARQAVVYTFKRVLSNLPGILKYTRVAT